MKHQPVRQGQTATSGSTCLCGISVQRNVQYLISNQRIQCRNLLARQQSSARCLKRRIVLNKALFSLEQFIYTV